MPHPVYSPGPKERTVRDAAGNVHDVPAGWQLLPPGDAGMTRRVKAAGKFLAVQEKKGRRMFSKGVWAPTTTIQKIEADLAAERSTDAYAKRQKSAAVRREKVQNAYVEDFQGAVVSFLNFHPDYEALAHKLATAVTQHATPVGSGTVARTQRIPIERRAESAVIAWMRHQTTAYDTMTIPRVKGKRREVRRMLAQRSKELLARYRQGREIPAQCPLRKALAA